MYRDTLAVISLHLRPNILQRAEYVGRVSVLSECPELVERGAAGRLPVEDTAAASACLCHGAAQYLTVLLTALVHHIRALWVDKESCLDNHHVAVILLRDSTDVLHAVSDGLPCVRLLLRLHGPVGVERHAYHIEFPSVLEYRVEVMVVQGVVETIVEMHYHDGFGAHALHGVVALADESGILLGVPLHMSHALCYRRVALSVLHLPSCDGVGDDAPQHTVRCLIAHLHPPWADTVVLEQCEHLYGVCPESLQHGLVRHLLPCLRDILLGRVGPPVRVVEINHYVHPERLGPQRLDEDILLVAPVAMS